MTDVTRRQFAKNLGKSGSAAQIRQSVSNTIRESTYLSKPRTVEPVDYETAIVKNKSLLYNDPLREMLLFPQDDISSSVLERRFRTVKCSVPTSAAKQAEGLLVRECINTYTADWNIVEPKYKDYSGSYLQLPRRVPATKLPEQLFEIDNETDTRDEESGTTNTLYKAHLNQITKQGWLYKCPDNQTEPSGLFTRSMKRRYFYLKQQQDTTYALDFHKDDKKFDSKGTIFLDSAVSVNKSSKKGRPMFEIHMADQSFYTLAAENEQDVDDWLNKLKKVLAAESIGGDDRTKDGSTKNDSKKEENHNMPPELAKYARETESYLAQQRKENRQKLFAVYPELPKNSTRTDDCYEGDVEVFKDQFEKRFVVTCEEFRTALQGNIRDDGETEIYTNPEPFFITMALYDAKRGRKVSEDFHYDPNSQHLRTMIPKELRFGINDSSAKNSEPELIVNPDWLLSRNKFILSVTVQDRSPEIYLVAKIEKVLQGGISAAVEPYIKSADPKLGTKVHKHMRQCCGRIGQYRMPFAWGARPVFTSRGELHVYSNFQLFRQESSRISEEELLRRLQDISRPDKQSKWQQIPASLKVTVEPYIPGETPISNTLTPSLVPVRPFAQPPEQSPTLEVDEFLPDIGELSYPYTSYINNLYVYPKSLKYDNQKTFAKARNIACCVELRDSDDENTTPLKRIYGRPGGPVFTCVASAPVLHHNSTPDFYDEVKINLPTQLNEKHHLLFTFYHVSCEFKASSRASLVAEAPVGYAWLPLLAAGRKFCSANQSLAIAATLPAKYLSHEPLGLGKGFTGPEIKWVDSGKQLFHCDLRLVSTIYTKDVHLHNFFQHCQKTDGMPTPANDMETSNKLKAGSGHARVENQEEASRPADLTSIIKSLLAVDVSVMVNFLPTLLNQLFHLLPHTNSEEVALNTVRVLVHVISMVHSVKKDDILHSYVKYVFRTTEAKHKTVHEELAKNLTMLLRPQKTDHLVLQKLLKHCWFFFEIMIKSMAQHLLTTGRIKMSRNERFPPDYQFRLQNMLQALINHIMHKCKEMPVETRAANRSLANFIRGCFTFMDRGVVFRFINIYMDHFNIGDTKVKHEYKFEFLETLCNFEHYIPLNLPLMKKGNIKTYKVSGVNNDDPLGLSKGPVEDLKHDYQLSEEYRCNHFLTGLLLDETRSALNELSDIRRFAIVVLRNILAKHSFDDRYSSKQHQSRIASLYLPLISVILENVNRLNARDRRKVGQTPNNNESQQQQQQTAAIETPDTPNKSATLTHSRSNLTVDQNSNSPALKRDSKVLAMIASPGLDLLDSKGIAGSTTSLISNVSSASALNLEQSGTLHKSDSFNQNEPVEIRHKRNDSVVTQSAGGGGAVLRTDKFKFQETKDLLIGFLYIVKNLSENVLLGWFNNSSENDILDFFSIIQVSLKNFEYGGRKRICTLSMISDSNVKSNTLPSKLPSRPSAPTRAISQYGEAPDGTYHSHTNSESEGIYRTILEANLASEIGLVTLDVVSLYCNNFRDQLIFRQGDNGVMLKIFDIYVSLVQPTQSEQLLKHVFASLRAFIHKFPVVLFHGNADICGKLCKEILRCCNSKLRSIRNEACALMYLLMRSNFELTGKNGFTRVHLQTIISVSQLISDVTVLSGSRFQDSLSVINCYANNDKALQQTRFPSEVKDLTKRIRTVLMATAQMKEHMNDQEMLIDLRYSLAQSYTSTPELRKTWLDSMARIHSQYGNYSEAAHCYLHVAALVAEYLKRRGVYPQGCAAFKQISPNIEMEESGIKDDSGMEDVQYSEDTLVDLLEECAEMFEKAERYEVMGDLYRLVIPIYEAQRDFQKLADTYLNLHRNYSKVVEVMQTGRRLLGKYFRVAFFGQLFEEENGRQYIYKEPKVTSLSDICERLKNLFTDKFGKNTVKLIMDSKKVNVSELSPKLAYIQVTYVTAHFEEHQEQNRVTDFERNNNIKHFMFETPFTRNGDRARGEIEDQWKRRTVLTTSNSFPFVKKRIQIVSHHEMELSPIEVAIDTMQCKNMDLNEVILLPIPDMIKLQLRLQGSVSVQVNAGPMALAEAFLAKEKTKLYPKNHVEALKQVFREFVHLCNAALILNAKLITSEQMEYHETMRVNFSEMVNQLNVIFNEQVYENTCIVQPQSLTIIRDLVPEDDEPPARIKEHRSSLTVFNVISATTGGSAV
ncbi:dedicator of cytokinesis protein 9-like [Tubulanus polymorphus]|uniref:dedicator of cytokinesis protein 9-like n=1 Tax=Tubulanus polymorphus TaxID=672921 RepID=UPI003DA43AE2